LGGYRLLLPLQSSRVGLELAEEVEERRIRNVLARAGIRRKLCTRKLTSGTCGGVQYLGEDVGSAKHAAKAVSAGGATSASTVARLKGVLSLLDVLDTLLQLGVLGLDLQAILVGLAGIVEAAKAVKGSAKTAVALLETGQVQCSAKKKKRKKERKEETHLCPLWLDADALLSVLEGQRVVLERRI